MSKIPTWLSVLTGLTLGMVFSIGLFAGGFAFTEILGEWAAGLYVIIYSSLWIPLSVYLSVVNKK